MKKLLDKYNNKEILKRLFEIYPDQKKNIGGYQQVLNSLRRMKAKKSNFVILPSKWNTLGQDIKDGETYAIEYTRWEEWLGMSIKTHKDGLTAICWCLYEMTWAGYSQQPIQRRINWLNKAASEIK